MLVCVPFDALIQNLTTASYLYHYVWTNGTTWLHIKCTDDGSHHVAQRATQVHTQEQTRFRSRRLHIGFGTIQCRELGVRLVPYTAGTAAV